MSLTLLACYLWDQLRPIIPYPTGRFLRDTFSQALRAWLRSACPSGTKVIRPVAEGAPESERVIALVGNPLFGVCTLLLPLQGGSVRNITQAKAWAMLSCPFGGADRPQ